MPSTQETKQIMPESSRFSRKGHKILIAKNHLPGYGRMAACHYEYKDQ